MEATLYYKIESYRKLCLQKDIVELNQWMQIIEESNTEINALITIEKHLINKNTIHVNLLGLRRKNTLVMASMCNYEQELKYELEYTRNEYNTLRSKTHEIKRTEFLRVFSEYQTLKNEIYKILSRFRLR